MSVPEKQPAARGICRRSRKVCKKRRRYSYRKRERTVSFSSASHSPSPPLLHKYKQIVDYKTEDEDDEAVPPRLLRICESPYISEDSSHPTDLVSSRKDRCKRVQTRNRVSKRITSKESSKSFFSVANLSKYLSADKEKKNKKRKSNYRQKRCASEVVQPALNPVFVWIQQDKTNIECVICQDYDKRNRIRIIKIGGSWRCIPLTNLPYKQFRWNTWSSADASSLSSEDLFGRISTTIPLQPNPTLVSPNAGQNARCLSVTRRVFSKIDKCEMDSTKNCVCVNNNNPDRILNGTSVEWQNGNTNDHSICNSEANVKVRTTPNNEFLVREVEITYHARKSVSRSGSCKTLAESEGDLVENLNSIDKNSSTNSSLNNNLLECNLDKRLNDNSNATYASINKDATGSVFSDESEQDDIRAVIDNITTSTFGPDNDDNKQNENRSVDEISCLINDQCAAENIRISEFSNYEVEATRNNLNCNASGILQVTNESLSSCECSPRCIDLNRNAVNECGVIENLTTKSSHADISNIDKALVSPIDISNNDKALVSLIATECEIKGETLRVKKETPVLKVPADDNENTSYHQKFSNDEITSFDVKDANDVTVNSNLDNVQHLPKTTDTHSCQLNHVLESENIVETMYYYSNNNNRQCISKLEYIEKMKEQNSNANNAHCILKLEDIERRKYWDENNNNCDDVKKSGDNEEIKVRNEKTKTWDNNNNNHDSVSNSTGTGEIKAPDGDNNTNSRSNTHALEYPLACGKVKKRPFRDSSEKIGCKKNECPYQFRAKRCKDTPCHVLQESSFESDQSINIDDTKLSRKNLNKNANKHDDVENSSSSGNAVAENTSQELKMNCKTSSFLPAVLRTPICQSLKSPKSAGHSNRQHRKDVPKPLDLNDKKFYIGNNHNLEPLPAHTKSAFPSYQLTKDKQSMLDCSYIMDSSVPILFDSAQQQEPLDLGLPTGKISTANADCHLTAKHSDFSSELRSPKDSIGNDDCATAKNRRVPIRWEMVTTANVHEYVIPKEHINEEQCSEVNKTNSHIPDLLMHSENVSMVHPVEQVKYVLSDPEIDVPDKLLVPRTSLTALVASPALEIPRLLGKKPQFLPTAKLVTIPVSDVQYLLHKRMNIDGYYNSTGHRMKQPYTPYGLNPYTFPDISEILWLPSMEQNNVLSYQHHPPDFLTMYNLTLPPVGAHPTTWHQNQSLVCCMPSNFGANIEHQKTPAQFRQMRRHHPPPPNNSSKNFYESDHLKNTGAPIKESPRGNVFPRSLESPTPVKSAPTPNNVQSSNNDNHLKTSVSTIKKSPCEKVSPYSLQSPTSIKSAPSPNNVSPLNNNKNLYEINNNLKNSVSTVKNNPYEHLLPYSLQSPTSVKSAPSLNDVSYYYPPPTITNRTNYMHQLGPNPINDRYSCQNHKRHQSDVTINHSHAKLARGNMPADNFHYVNHPRKLPLFSPNNHLLEMNHHLNIPLFAHNNLEQLDMSLQDYNLQQSLNREFIRNSTPADVIAEVPVGKANNLDYLKVYENQYNIHVFSDEVNKPDINGEPANSVTHYLPPPSYNMTKIPTKSSTSHPSKPKIKVKDHLVDPNLRLNWLNANENMNARMTMFGEPGNHLWNPYFVNYDRGEKSAVRNGASKYRWTKPSPMPNKH